MKDNEWVKGILYIKTQLEKFLTDSEVEVIESVGKEFDPSIHECVSQEKSDKVNIVVQELSKGYKLNDKILRPAKVVVGK